VNKIHPLFLPPLRKGEDGTVADGSSPFMQEKHPRNPLQSLSKAKRDFINDGQELKGEKAPDTGFRRYGYIMQTSF
jgi:hypothetical protein